MTKINYIQSGEDAVGKGHATKPDTLNRGVRDLQTLSGLDPDADFAGFALPSQITGEAAARAAADTAAIATAAADATTKANAAQAAAIAAASTDATTKANNAQSAAQSFATSAVGAEATSRAAADVSAIASAKTYTDGVIATEQTARNAGDAATLSAAATDATTKANAAQSAAQSFATSAVGTEATARAAADTSAIATANAHADGAVATEASARVAGDAALAASLAGDYTAETIAFSDDFERANTSGTLGTSSSGGAWQPLSGAAAATAGITSGRFVSPNGVVYAGYVAGARPLRIGGKFSISGAGSSFALISSADPSIQLLKMVHCIFDENGFTVTWWNGASQANAFASQSGVGYANGPLLTDGTVYEIWMTIRGNTVHIDLPDGSTWDGYDPNVSTLSGALTIWELTTSNRRWESVAVDSGITKTVRGAAVFTGGLQGTPIGNVTPASGRFTQAAVGVIGSTLSPQAAFHAFGPGLGTKPDTAWFESPAGHAIVRIKASTGGFSPQLLFDEGLANPPRIYASGNANDLRLAAGGQDRLLFPQVGVTEFQNQDVQITEKNLTLLAAVNHPIIRLKATGAGFSPQLFFDQGAANPPRVYALGNANDLRLATGGIDRVVIPTGTGSTMQLIGTGGIDVTTGDIARAGTKVVGTRKTGWAPWTGTATRTAFATGTATLQNVAEALKALIDDLHGTAGHGLIGT